MQKCVDGKFECVGNILRAHDKVSSLRCLNIHQKSTLALLKILVFEIKCCSKLHFTVAQPQIVLNLSLTFGQF